MTKVEKIIVKPGFDKIDAIIYEAGMILNAAATLYKQKEYVR